MFKSSSSLNSNFSASILKSFEGKGYVYNELPKKLRERLENGEKISNLTLFKSPL